MGAKSSVNDAITRHLEQLTELADDDDEQQDDDSGNLIDQVCDMAALCNHLECEQLVAATTQQSPPVLVNGKELIAYVHSTVACIDSHWSLALTNLVAQYSLSANDALSEPLPIGPCCWGRPCTNVVSRYMYLSSDAYVSGIHRWCVRGSEYDSFGIFATDKDADKGHVNRLIKPFGYGTSSFRCTRMGQILRDGCALVDTTLSKGKGKGIAHDDFLYCQINLDVNPVQVEWYRNHGAVRVTLEFPKVSSARVYFFVTSSVILRTSSALVDGQCKHSW